MATRKIVRINELKCNGCGLCVPSCAEGAIQIIEGKARLVKEQYCDGLGACLGECPQGAITIEEREAAAFDETAVQEHLTTLGQSHGAEQQHTGGPGFAEATQHQKVTQDQKDTQAQKVTQGQKVMQDQKTTQGSQAASGAQITPAAKPTHKPPAGGCPGAAAITLGGCPGSAPRSMPVQRTSEAPAGHSPPSMLRNWPVQLKLVPVMAPYLEGAELCIAADCTAFAFADFHKRMLAGKVLLIGCPKLDDVKGYIDKLAAIFQHNQIRSVEVVHMEVPCCFGLVHLVRQALAESNREIPVTLTKVGIEGQVVERLQVQPDA